MKKYLYKVELISKLLSDLETEKHEKNAWSL